MLCIVISHVELKEKRPHYSKRHGVKHMLTVSAQLYVYPWALHHPFKGMNVAGSVDNSLLDERAPPCSMAAAGTPQQSSGMGPGSGQPPQPAGLEGSPAPALGTSLGMAWAWAGLRLGWLPCAPGWGPWGQVRAAGTWGPALLRCHCVRGSWAWALARATVTARPGHVGVHKTLPG